MIIYWPKINQICEYLNSSVYGILKDIDKKTFSSTIYNIVFKQVLVLMGHSPGKSLFRLFSSPSGTLKT